MFNWFRKKPIKTKGFGLIETTPEKTDFILGSAQAQKYLLSPERDLSAFLPTKELQSRAYETWSCVSFSCLNNIEILYKKLFGTEINASDRYLASLSDTVPNSGNSFKKVGDTLRKNGLVMEEIYPWEGANVEQYLQKPSQEIIDKGRAFLQSFEIQYEWIGWGGCNPEDLYRSLQFGPLQVSVDANATYTGERSFAVNHAVTIYKSVKNKSFSIFDHYDREKYDLPWSFYFGSAFQYSLLKKKYLPLIMVYGRPEIYVIVGTEACHVADESTWKYGEQIGLWDKGITVMSQNNFNQTYSLGKPIVFK